MLVHNICPHPSSTEQPRLYGSVPLSLVPISSKTRWRSPNTKPTRSGPGEVSKRRPVNARAGTESRPTKADDGQDRALALGWELDRPTDLRPPPANHTIPQKVTDVSICD